MFELISQKVTQSGNTNTLKMYIVECLLNLCFIRGPIIEKYLSNSA